MSEKPDNWSQLNAEEKRRLRLDAWVRGDGIQFESPEAQENYRKRAQRFRDALEMEKVPDRVPIAGLGGAFIFRRLGVPQKSTMYDRWQEAADAAIQFQVDFEPDSATFLFLMSGASMELLGQTNMKWAGYGLPDDIQYQFLEQEYMKADEYDHFLSDPSDFVLRCFVPRMYSGLLGLKHMPKFGSDGIGIGGMLMMPFLNPEVQDALDKLKRAAEMSIVPGKITMDTMVRMTQMGFPSMSTGFGAAPFDVLGDTLRGTRGVEPVEKAYLNSEYDGDL
jgi:hypothetical protein